MPKALLYPFTESKSKKVVLQKGLYLFECWGAQGCGSTNNGKGAYAKGSLFLNKTTNLFLFIGKTGVFKASTPAFNGGGAGQGGGDGATDIRLVDGEWDDFSSLKSRIIVAAGGRRA